MINTPKKIMAVEIAAKEPSKEVVIPKEYQWSRENSNKIDIGARGTPKNLTVEKKEL